MVWSHVFRSTKKHLLYDFLGGNGLLKVKAIRLIGKQPRQSSRGNPKCITSGTENSVNKIFVDPSGPLVCNISMIKLDDFVL